MSKEAGIPSAPNLDFENYERQNLGAPPSYNQAMSSQPGFVTQPHMYPQSVQQPYYPPVNYPSSHPAPYYPPANNGIPQGDPHSQVPLIPNYPPNPQQAIPQPQVTTVVVNNPVIPVGPNPVKIICPQCRSNIKTSTVSHNQAGAHIACVILCLLGCCLCCWIPYCMDSCKTVEHKCPACKTYVGTFKA